MMPDRALLLRLAREAIETSFWRGDVTPPDEPWLQRPGAVFVTLRQRADGALRGCVGSIEPRMPLGQAVVWAARAAAFHDGRFAPLTSAELRGVHLEISVLSPLNLLAFADEFDALELLARTRPGVVFASGQRRSVLLPKVWDSVADAAEFLGHLKLKAGFSPTYWAEDVELHVFTCDEFSEEDVATGRVHAL